MNTTPVFQSFPKLRLLCRIYARLVLIICLTVMLQGCFFPSGLTGFVTRSFGEPTQLSISTLVQVDVCSEGEAEFVGFTNTLLVNCLFQEGDVMEYSSAELRGVSESTGSILDPLILQLPVSVTSIAASYSHSASGSGGPLAVTGGLTSIAADLDNNIVAEPGTQLVILDLPPGAPTSGDFAFNLNFSIPSGVPSIDIKALFTGLQSQDGQDFYFPLLPCLTDFSSIPPITVGLLSGGDVPINLPSPGGFGCDAASYRFGAVAPGDDATGIPVLPLGALIALMLSLLVVARRQVVDW